MAMFSFIPEILNFSRHFDSHFLGVPHATNVSEEVHGAGTKKEQLEMMEKQFLSLKRK